MAGAKWNTLKDGSRPIGGPLSLPGYCFEEKPWFDFVLFGQNGDRLTDLFIPL
jgi:hypothetical protein